MGSIFAEMQGKFIKSLQKDQEACTSFDVPQTKILLRLLIFLLGFVEHFSVKLKVKPDKINFIYKHLLCFVDSISFR